MYAYIYCAVRKQKCSLRDEGEKQQFAHTAIGSTSCQRSASLSSFYHSAPVGLNVLSSIPVPDFMSRSSQNGWNILSNGNTVSAALSSELSYPIQNQNCLYGNAVFKSPSAECIDFSTNSKENSRNQSPMAGESQNQIKVDVRNWNVLLNFRYQTKWLSHI
jgi:hypothetical protein